jgi:hypothetical protein
MAVQSLPLADSETHRPEIRDADDAAPGALFDSEGSDRHSLATAPLGRPPQFGILAAGTSERDPGPADSDTSDAGALRAVAPGPTPFDLASTDPCDPELEWLERGERRALRPARGIAVAVLISLPIWIGLAILAVLVR